jgi:hypothetical protein
MQDAARCSVQEDCLSFSVFVYDGNSAQLLADSSALEVHALRFQQHVSPLVAGHIWQHDSLRFALQVSIPERVQDSRAWES